MMKFSSLIIATITALGGYAVYKRFSGHSPFPHGKPVEVPPAPAAQAVVPESPKSAKNQRAFLMLDPDAYGLIDVWLAMTFLEYVSPPAQDQWAEYSNDLRDAVKTFQYMAKLPQTGETDAATWDAIVKTARQLSATYHNQNVANGLPDMKWATYLRKVNGAFVPPEADQVP